MIRKARWLTKVTITEYYPVPESWFVGQKVTAPGLPGQHRIDWLYSARGVSMEGDGLDLDGNPVHIADVGSGGWVDQHGNETTAGGGGDPFWRAGAYWKTPDGWVTFPLDAGGWFHGVGASFITPPNATFAPGESRPLTPYKSIAVDPDLIPMGSKVYVPQYKDHGGWFKAADTGGAIQGRHVDVFRTPPASIDETGNLFTGARIYVVPPRQRRPSGTPPDPGSGTGTTQPATPQPATPQGGSAPAPGPSATGGTSGG
ncbi:MAG TPA: 3D domain-containing protein [Solirubrobacteraceae bacterium]|nr:3D domain-containing protein [Solirubrobacteraceae bacterium]